MVRVQETGAEERRLRLGFWGRRRRSTSRWAPLPVWLGTSVVSVGWALRSTAAPLPPGSAAPRRAADEAPLQLTPWQLPTVMERTRGARRT